jgi:hypothetical protein
VSEERKKRLAKLVKLENRLKAFHESRHAGHLAEARNAAADAAEVSARFDDPGSLSALFPQVYHRKVESALAEQARALENAKKEERQIAAATVRTNRVGERYREAARTVEEERAARERQELVDRNARMSPAGKPATR